MVLYSMYMYLANVLMYMYLANVRLGGTVEQATIKTDSGAR